jgi:putative addiction module component (TIGR02574 family)
MPKLVPLPPPGFDDLSVNEKIDYLQSLWDRIAATPESIPVPEWHREILDERLRDLEADPNAGDSWDVVQKRLRGKLDHKH